jgi:hypothetical protein
MAEDKKPNVFPTPEQIAEANKNVAPVNPVQSPAELDGYSASPNATEAEKQAANEMYERTKAQIQARDEQLKKAVENANQNDSNMDEIMKRAEEQKAIRDAMLNQQYQAPPVTINEPPQVPPTPPSTPTDNSSDDSYKLPEGYVKELMEPQWDAPYDMIPLPSDGKLYKGVKPNIRVAYLNASDENLLTSPHILQSDEFLEILINRKILEPNLRYNDLHIGDRNAVMIWLRATAYGTEYPITILDNNGEPFDYDFDLTELKTKKLGAEPDENGLFDFKLPTNGNVVKFKFLNAGEVERLDAKVSHEEKVLKLPINNTITYTLQEHIVSINGETDPSKLKSAIEYMRSSDRKALMDYINDIESGLDLEITVPAPYGEPVTTLLPLNFNFFWPNARI